MANDNQVSATFTGQNVTDILGPIQLTERDEEVSEGNAALATGKLYRREGNESLKRQKFPVQRRSVAGALILRVEIRLCRKLRSNIQFESDNLESS
jgi:hypothetical protein